MSRAAAAHAATFSWDNTVDALLASYRRAIGDFTADAQRPVPRPGSDAQAGRALDAAARGRGA